jgi:O-antigen/teichoic acid export membrane protein
MRQLGVSMIGNILSALIGVVGIRVLTELVPPSVFGETNLILNLLTLGIALLVNPFSNTMLRYQSRAESKEAADAFTRAAMNWTIVVSALTTLIFLAGAQGGQALRWFDFNHGVLAPAAVWLLATGARQVLVSRLQADTRLRAYSTIIVLEAALLVGVSAVLLTIWRSSNAYLWGQAIAVVCIVGVCALIASPLRRAPTGEPWLSHDFAKLAWRYGAPFLPLAVLGWFANLSDRYVLANVLGSAAAGEYLAAAAISSRGMMLLGAAATDVMRPRLFDAVNRNDSAGVSRVLRQWLALRVSVGLVGVAGLAVFGCFIAHHLLAEEYRGHATAIMLWVGGAFAVLGLAQVLETRLFSLDRAAWVIPAVALGAAANVGFSLWFIPAGGVVGAGQALCAGYAVQLAGTTFMLATAHRVRGRTGIPTTSG